MKRTALLTSIAAASLLSSNAVALVTPFATKAPDVPPAGEAPPAPASLAVGTVSDIESGWTPPARTGKGGGPSPYKDKIEKLEVGQSFHIAGRTKKSLNSTMHTFNKNYRRDELDANGQPVTEVKVIKNKDGTETRKVVNKQVADRVFDHYDVDATDKLGVGVRVYRSK